MLASLHGILLSDIPAILFIITVVVFFHELGHFLVARACGVKVDVFSIGFGREIVGWNDRRGTRWKLSWIPLGGYVKFAGDADAASTPDRAAARLSAAERAVMLQFKPLWQRAAVVVAGPLANFVVAVTIFTALFMYTGHVTLAPIVGGVTKGGAAEAAGIKPGDRIMAINGSEIDDFDQLPQIISMHGGEDLAVLLDRHGRRLTLHVVPRPMKLPDGLGKMESSYGIGVSSVVGLRPERHYYSPPGAFVAACRQTADIVQTSLVGIVKLIQGHASADQVGGTIRIVQVTHVVAQMGFLALLNLSAVLSVSIGLINLFPIPLLDGGHLLYYGCEAVLGRPLGARAQELGFRFGVIVILGLVLATAFHDLARLNLF